MLPPIRPRPIIPSCISLLPSSRPTGEPLASRRRGPLHLSSHHLKLDAPRLADPLRSIEDFQRDEVAMLVIVENDPGLVLVTLRDFGTLLEDDAQGIGPRIID